MVVTEVGADYGGPGTVAVQQARCLAERGHDVTLVSTRADLTSPTHESDGSFMHRMFPARSRGFPLNRLTQGPFATRRSPELARWLGESTTRFDVAHVHFAREIIPCQTVRTLLGQGVPTFLQTHGMVAPDGGLRRLADALLIRRLLRDADGVFALQSHEEWKLLKVEPSARIHRLPNGINAASVGASWTSGGDKSPYVLFVARLHPRKRVLAFVRMAGILAAAGERIRFRVIGADGGDMAAARATASNLGLNGRMTFEGPKSRPEVFAAMSGAVAFVLPSMVESFPMTVLEALAVGVPCVVTEDCDIADQLDAAGAALVSSPDPQALADSVSQIVADSDLASNLSRSGRELVDSTLSLHHVGDELERCYHERIVVTDRLST